MPGLPKKYARMGFKKGWRAFKASKKTTKTKNVKNLARKKRTYRRRRRAKRRTRRNKAIPLAIVLPAAAPFLEAATNPQVQSAIKSGDGFGAAKSVVNILSMRYTGYSTYSKDWNIQRAIPTWTGIVAGIMVHKLAGKHINRHLKKIPLIGKYLAI